MQPPVPAPEGVQDDGTVSQQASVPKYELKLKGVTQLSQITDGFAFFTPAVLYLYDWIHDGMYVDFMRSYGEIKLHFIRFNQPIFQKLEARSNGDPGWNYALWAVPRDRWDVFSAWLCSLMLVSSDKERVARIGETELDIIDPVVSDSVSGVLDAKLPTVHISAFGIDGSHEQRGISRRTSLVLERPSMQTRPPTDAMQKYLTAIKEST